MSVNLRVEKFNIASKDHGRTRKCDFSNFERKLPFWANLVKKPQNGQCKLKFGIYTNSNMQSSVALFTFSVLHGKHQFWASLVQRFKFVSLSWNLVPTLVRIRRIQCRCTIFLFWTGDVLFGQIRSKMSKLSI